jgi:diguanylate cyclase (GGDEF)-like protein/PAS domain S-box-containing protein
MPYLAQIHQLFSNTPLLTALGPFVLLLAALAVVYYLRLTRQLREQFARQQVISVQLQQLSTAVEHAPSSIVITDCKGHIEYVNPAFCRLTGYSKQEALGQHTRILKGEGENQSPELFRELWETITAGREWHGEFYNRRKDGSHFWESASISPILDADGEITHFVAVKEDITERKHLLECLDHLAHYDKLTSLPNRALFFDRLNQAIAVSHREGQCFALLFLDLDGFKQVNDSCGHEAGDRVLQVTAERMAGCTRETDTVARMGGDEFIAILTNLAHPEDAGLVAEKILAEVGRPIELSRGGSCMVGCSIGISLYPQHSTDPAQLVSAADSAMYEVKRQGKNRCGFFVG